MAKNKGLYGWQYYDNPYSAWGKISDDLAKSKQFQGLSNVSKILYFNCISYYQSKQATDMLYNWKKQYYADLGIEKSEYDLNYESHPGKNRDFRQFVFPEKYYTEYGYTKQKFWNDMQPLLKAGFIEKLVDGHHDYRVSLYQFSDKWKRK